MLNVVFKSRFKKDLKKLKSSNRNEEDLLVVIERLANDKPLEPKNRDHNLIGEYAGCRECHWIDLQSTVRQSVLEDRTGETAE